MSSPQARSECQSQRESHSERQSERHHSEQYEQDNVHRVYELIAAHFSETRYKPWPIVEAFLKDLPDGAVGLDVGCGNGKYLKVNSKIFIVASDRSENLVKISSRHTPHTSIIADTLSLPHPRSSFDFAISIAVIHHLSTSARRINALAAIFETLRPSSTTTTTTTNEPPPNDNFTPGRHTGGGRALIYVWALEQKHSRRGWDEGDAQDVMVPWVMKNVQHDEDDDDDRRDAEKPPTHPLTLERYYHLYRRGELEEDIRTAGGTVERSGYERDNWWAIASRSLAS